MEPVKNRMNVGEKEIKLRKINNKCFFGFICENRHLIGLTERSEGKQKSINREASKKP